MLCVDLPQGEKHNSEFQSSLWKNPKSIFFYLRFNSNLQISFTVTVRFYKTVSVNERLDVDESEINRMQVKRPISRNHRRANEVSAANVPHLCGKGQTERLRGRSVTAG